MTFLKKAVKMLILSLFLGGNTIPSIVLCGFQNGKAVTMQCIKHVTYAGIYNTACDINRILQHIICNICRKLDYRVCYNIGDNNMVFSCNLFRQIAA